ncbi:Alpha/beta hydrolase family protein [Caulifigura coniformis]|uniref:Alpha/beta hydrolase family protein n=1 Tax=Caulifigura coniformis TaxID=2527983 RepID=A0A517SEM1_9PLAN|nr:alpha/beta fold hydrolase [Caulifigura coniformis]QDT54583.1 Alpha/beta hydrolase family protein [Caulifigura coniformis]
MHGTGSNFTAPGILEGLAQLLSSRGEAVLRLNTRGHDLVAKIPTMSGSVRGGAAYESLADAHLDIEAAAAWLNDAGYEQLSLLGHSLGGVKAIVSQSEHPIKGVEEIVALSPPRLQYEQLIQDHAFRRHFDQARQLVDDGRGDELVEMTSPLRLWIPARGIVEKYGIEDRFDFVSHLPRVQPATLVFIDSMSLESSIAHRGLEDALADVARSHSAFTVHRHPDDIRYAGSEVAIANQIVGWRAKRDTLMDAGI